MNLPKFSNDANNKSTEFNLPKLEQDLSELDKSSSSKKGVPKLPSLASTPHYDEQPTNDKNSDLIINTNKLDDIKENNDELISDNFVIKEENYNVLDETFKDLSKDSEFENHANEYNDEFNDDNIEITLDGDFNPEDFDPEDFNPEDDYSFLPVVEFDEEEDFEQLLPEVSLDNKKEIGKVDRKQNQGFKEINDELIKELFNKIKNKLFSNNKNIKKGKPSKKAKITKNKNKFNIVRFIKSKIIIYSITVIIFIALIIFAFKFNIMTYKPLNELSFKLKQNDIKIKLDEFNYDDNKIMFKISNDGEMPANFFMNVNFKYKSGLNNEEFVCESDILMLDYNDKINEFLYCDNFEEDLLYKVKINIVEIK